MKTEPSIALIIISCSIIYLTPIYGFTSKEVVLNPIADSYTYSLKPDNNYGGSSSLIAAYGKMDSFQYIDNVYLMFDLAGLPQGITVESATLTLYVVLISSTMKVYLHFCQSISWKELEINWRNAPRYVDKPVSVTIVAKSDEFYSMDATEAIKQALAKGLNKVTLVITTEPKPSIGEGVSFASREWSVEKYRPKLKLVYSIRAPTKTATETKMVKTTPTSIATSLQTARVTITETITTMQTFKEVMYVTITHRAEVQPYSSMAVTFIAGLVLGFLLARSIRKPRRLEAGPPPKEALKSKLGIKYCPYCGGELKPLGATGKSICRKCGIIEE